MNEPLNVSKKLIKTHLVHGDMHPETEIGLRIDQLLQQDATGTLVMLELESMGLDRVQTEVAVQYVDHNLLQTDYKNADDHRFLQSAAKQFGYWFSRPGNGISHPVHMQQFGIPGKTLLGSDSHTCSAGGLGMLAIGTGGLDVAMAAAGEDYFVSMPKIMGVELQGNLPPWVSAKDVILEMLRRYGVKGGVGYIIEYFGEGVKDLSAWDRHVIANMGAELGATTSIFPSDKRTLEHLSREKRADVWSEIKPDEGAGYDRTDTIVLNDLEPLIAQPHSPGNVVKVRDLSGQAISQVVIGSSANPGLRDFWMAGEIVAGHTVHPDVSMDINPSSLEIIQNLGRMGSYPKLMAAGVRFHQSGCMGCIGMGQAPASGTISLRTFPRNFPGRSGTEDDQVYLCSPETAAASALTGVITDPRELAKRNNFVCPDFSFPEDYTINNILLIEPTERKDARDKTPLEKGPNIKSLPILKPLKDSYKLPVILKLPDNISTDEILKAGSDVLPLRSNIEAISAYTFYAIDKEYADKARETLKTYASNTVIAGENYAQGSSREHAALAPRHLGQKIVFAKSYARIGWQNLVNFGILPLEFSEEETYESIDAGDVISISNIHGNLDEGASITCTIEEKDMHFEVRHSLSSRQCAVVRSGGMINYLIKTEKG